MYVRPRVFRPCLQSLARAKVARGIIAVVDAPDSFHREEYLEVIGEVRLEKRYPQMKISSTRTTLIITT